MKRVLDDLDEDKAIAEADSLAGAQAKLVLEITKRLPPVVNILSPAEGSAFASDSLSVSYGLRSPSNLPITGLVALADGRPLFGMKGHLAASATEDSESELMFRASPSATSRCRWRLWPTSGKRARQRPSEIQGRGAGTRHAAGRREDVCFMRSWWAWQSSRTRPSTSSPGPRKLRHFAAALKTQTRLYRKIEVKLLTDEDADNGSIIDGFSWLQRQVGQGDIGIVFLAGHGATSDSGEYYYVPYNARLEDMPGGPLPLRGTSVPDAEISRALKQLAGNALFFFDTCHSGRAAGVTSPRCTAANAPNPRPPLMRPCSGPRGA